MATELGFGVVGLGMGLGRAKKVRATEGARLAAVADLREDRLATAREELGADTCTCTDYQELLARDDVDVVLVMTPSGLHAKIAIEAARAGKHVATTKPMDVSLEAVDRMTASCEAAGVVLAVDFDLRYNPAAVQIKRAIDAGAFGRLLLGEARLKWYRADSYYDNTWRGTWRYDGGGSLMNQTVHQIDLLLWYLGPVERVVGQTAVMTHNIETEDMAMALLRFRNGALGTILGTTTFPESIPARVEVHGDRGAAFLARENIDYWKIRDEEGATAPDFDYDGPHNIIEDMIAVVRDGKQPVTPPAEGRRSVELICAIYESARTGKPVVL